MINPSASQVAIPVGPRFSWVYLLLGEHHNMPQKLSTIIAHCEKLPHGQVECVLGFRDWKVDRDSSDRNIKNYLLVMNLFARHLDGKPFADVTREDIIEFLDTKKKNQQDDPDEKWKTTWNSYCNRIAGFYFWFVNQHKTSDPDEWEMPAIVSTIKRKKSKRLSPYSPNDVWLEHEILCVLKYCVSLRDKLVITLMWDLAGRNHEIVKLRIKHIIFKEKYAIVSIPWDSKTGERSNPAILSFPYLRDYINDHPFSKDPDAFLVLSEYTDKPILPDNLHNIMMRLRERVTEMLETGKIADGDTETIRNLMRKPWNPYLVGRHSSITEKTDILLDHQLTSFAGWTVNTKRRATYSHRSGKQTRTPLLQHHGIEHAELKVPSRKECHSCGHINTAEASICAKCNLVLDRAGFETVTKEEQAQQKKIEEQDKKIEEQSKKMDEMEKKMYSFLQMLPEAKSG